MRNLKMILEYDGSAYHGWQRQKDLPTVQQVIEDCLSRVTQEKTTVIGSGRTDTGVHALNQAAHFKTESLIGARNLLLAVNSLLPDDVAIKDLQEAEASFHARYDVKSKVYMYQIFQGPIRSPLYRRFAFHARYPLNMENMELGLELLKGRHDFSSFCGKKVEAFNCIREIKTVRLERTTGNLLRIYIEADGFIRYMVRTIVGTLFEIGMGKRKPEDIECLLEAKDRRLAGVTAPARGLFLSDVKY